MDGIFAKLHQNFSNKFRSLYIEFLCSLKASCSMARLKSTLAIGTQINATITPAQDAFALHDGGPLVTLRLLGRCLGPLSRVTRKETAATCARAPPYA